MTNTFAIDVIHGFQAPEVSEFRLFLDSPYFNKGYHAESVKPLFEQLYEQIQLGTIETLGKEDLHNLLFPGKTFIESKIDKLMSELKRLLERFLLTQRYFSDSNEAHNLLDLSSEMRLRGLESRYQQALDRAKKHIETVGDEALDKLFFRFLIAKEEQAWYSTYNRVKTDLNIPKTIQNLEEYYYAHKTWMLNHLMLLQRATLLPPINHAVDPLWQIPTPILRNSALISIFWEIHNLLKQEVSKVEEFQQLVKKIQISEHDLSPESIAEAYAYLRNLCVILIDAGNIQLYTALHEINADNLTRGYFYKNNKISPNACLNITQVAINAGEISWANTFIEYHKDKIIDENESLDFYRVNKALCLFGEKKFDEALHIIPFGSTYSFYHLMARRLELKIYYELNSELLEHKIDAFKMFIRRSGKKVLSQNLHELFTNFVNFVRQLNQSQGPHAKQRSPVMTKRITEKQAVAERLWLLEKAQELGQKR